ncbi:uncharacterized protein LOC135830864 [Sycon ciliatum]|uniref:uncharacterized protein LOC135830864 n=1 Tax=Sycon ciliatum TaxID=27933 RepID=UPI0031F69DF6
MDAGAAYRTGNLFKCPQCQPSSSNSLPTLQQNGSKFGQERLGESAGRVVSFRSMNELKRHLASHHKIGSLGQAVTTEEALYPGDDVPNGSVDDVQDCSEAGSTSSGRASMAGLDSGRASQTSQHNCSTLDGLVERAQSLEDHLRRTHASAALVDRSRESSESAAKRLSAELLRSKQQYWTAVDAMQKAHDDVRSMRLSLVRGEVAGVDMELVGQCSKLSEELLAVKASDRRRESELEVVQGHCRTLQLECTRLQQAATDLAGQADKNAEVVGVLKAELVEKDRSAQQLNQFLALQAKRQEVARDELRNYISHMEQQIEKLQAQSPTARKESMRKGSTSLSASFPLDTKLPDELVAVFNVSQHVSPEAIDHDSADSDSDSETNEVGIDALSNEQLLHLSGLQDKDGDKLMDYLTEEEQACVDVFKYLGTADLFRVGAVCKKWRKLSRLPKLWTHISLVQPRITNKLLNWMARWCTHIYTLRLEGIQSREARPDESVLDYITSMKGSLEPGLLRLLSAGGRLVRKVYIADCGVMLTQSALWTVSSCCPYLEEFHYVSEEYPASPSSLWSLAQGCPKIRTLRVPPVQLTEKAKDFTDDCVKQIVQGWPNLTHLAIGGPSLTLDGFVALASGCPRLEVLELDRCAAINEHVAMVLCKNGFRGLRRLELFLTRISTQAVVTFVGACPRLENLSIHIGISDYYNNTTDPSNIAEFNSAIQEFKNLATNQPYKDILAINATYG